MLVVVGFGGLCVLLKSLLLLVSGWCWVGFGVCYVVVLVVVLGL